MSEQDNLPHAPGRRGHEAWDVTFTDSRSGVGYWIRSSILVPARGSNEAAVLFARFDPAQPSRAFGVRLRGARWSSDPEVFDVRIAETAIRSGRAQGSVEADGRTMSWQLDWPTGAPSYRPILSAASRPLARAGVVVPNPDVRFTGLISVDDEEVEVPPSAGQQGHVFGSRHAERWARAHCGDFRGERAVLHALTAQGRRGPVTMPHVTTVGLWWDGRWIDFRRTSPVRDFGLGTWRIDAANPSYRLTGRIEASTQAMLRARYLDPDGTPRHAHVSQVASCRLALFEKRPGGFEEIALLESNGTTHAEWVGRTPARSVPRAVSEVEGSSDPQARTAGSGA